MKIRSLELQNIGVFANETIAFPENKEKGKAEIHILTGENGTGKTTILQALAVNIQDIFPLNIYHKVGEDTFLKRIRHYTNSEINYSILLDNGQFIKVSNGNIEEIRTTTMVDLNFDFFTFSAFAYSGYRFIEHQENINIRANIDYDPLENALEFNKDYSKNDYTLNQWLAVTIAKRNNAFFEGNQPEVEKFSKSIENLKQIIEAIIEIPIDFKFKNETSKIVAIKNGQELDFDLLPDGLRSIISWLGDLIMRMDALKWENDTPLFEREFILFLDEIEVHLHPRWQRKILPVVQKLFKNAQIFITTHSPFIVNSVDGAWIHQLKMIENGVKIQPAICSENGDSIFGVLKDIFGVHEEFGIDPQIKLDRLIVIRTELLENKSENLSEFLRLGKELSIESQEINTIVQFELRQLNRILNQKWEYA